MGLKGQNGGLKMFKMGKGKLKNEMNLKNGLGTYNYQTFDTHDDNFLLRPIWPICVAILTYFGIQIPLWS